MSPVHVVVVWEWEAEGGAWLPHAAGVARTLERAHGKQLTRVVLADAEPALRGHSVNLRTLTQTAHTLEGASVECRVRRACYSVASPAGRGVRWEWAHAAHAARHGADRVYEPLPMEIQCVLEEAWSGGRESVSFGGWVARPRALAARPRAGGPARALRRAPHPPYPLTRNLPAPAAPSPAPPTPPARTPVEGRRGRIPQQHTGSSVHSVQSARSAPGGAPAPAAAARGGARSASPRDRKPGLARQILHNLNIFSNNSNRPASAALAECQRQPECELERDRDRDRELDADSGSARSGGRRHSVDTVSTYLSHESKDSLQQASVGELLNCSAGSDDVFEQAPPLPPLPLPLPLPVAEDGPTSDGSIVGVDSASAAVCVWVRAVACPQWGAVCPACLRALAAPAPAPAPGVPGAPAAPPAGACVALTRCQHMLHLHCLNNQLERLRAVGEPLYIECLVCGLVYGRGRAAAGAAAAAAGAEPAGAAEGTAEQPAGSMAWCRQPAPLPTHPQACTILVTYNFQSGRQGPRHPAPGAPYYAVGFPRRTVLPDTPLGRQVLSALRGAWERRRLFCICASQTTGREHVVAWRVAPPPPARHYEHARAALAERALLAALARLHTLVAPHDCETLS